jgi:N-acyl-D-aspartate/D-glutamate deacylase
MPGIIDLHTHYDAQVTWDPTCRRRPRSGSRRRSWGIAVSASCRARRHRAT